MDSMGVVSIVVAGISCLISLSSYFNNKNKEYIEKLDTWRNSFSNKINNLLEFCGQNSAFAFKFDFSNSLMFDFNSKKDSEQYNAYVKSIVVKEIGLTHYIKKRMLLYIYLSTKMM